MSTVPVTPVIASNSTPVVPLPVAPVAPKVKPVTSKLTGEARLNAILLVLQDKHGISFPLALFDPKTDK